MSNLSTAADDALYRKILWRLLPILCVAYIVNYIDRTNVGFAKLQMSDQLGFSDAAFGLGAGVFFIGYALFEVPSNLLLTRWGARKTFLRIMALWGLMSAATAFVSTPLQFYVARFLLGVAEAGFAPGVLFYFGLWFPERRRAHAMALFFAAFAAAPIVSGPLASLIMTSLDGAQGMRGWQWLFILEGLPAVALGFAAFRWLDDGPADAAWLTADEKQTIRRALEEDAGAEKTADSLWRTAIDHRVWLLGAIYFLVLLGVYALTFWQPTMLESMGLTLWQIGFVSMIPAAAGVVSAIVVGRHSDRSGERRLHFAFPALAGAAALALTVHATQSAAIAILCLSVATAGIAACMPVFWSVPGALLSKRAAAGGVALINTIGITAGALAPPLVGALKTQTGGFAASLYLLSGALLLAALLMLFAWREPQRTTTHSRIVHGAA